MRGPVKLTLLGIVAYGLFLLATLPASLAVSALPEDLPVQLSGVSGSLWQGRARQLGIGPQALGELRWALRPWALLGGRAGGELQLRGPWVEGRAELDVGLGGRLRLREGRFRAPAQLVQELQALPVELGGQLFLRVDELVLEPGAPLPRLKAELVWAQAGISAPYPMALGEYSLDLESRDGGIQGRLSERDGPFRASGNLLLREDGRYQLTLRLVPDRNTPPELRDGLRLLGRPDARGAVTIRQQGSLAALF